MFAANAIVPAAAGDLRIAVLTGSPVTAALLFDGQPIDCASDRTTVTFALTGTRNSDVDFVIHESNRPSTLAAPPPLPDPLPDPLRFTDPAAWPRSAMCRGVVGGRPVIATGSILGCVWLWDLATRKVTAGPFARLPEGPRTTVPLHHLRMKGGPSSVSFVALGRHPRHGDVLAVAHEGSVRLVSVPAGELVFTPATEATVVTAVALGRLLGEEALVTGSQGGVVVVWGLASNKRIAALTLDDCVESVWVVHGSDAIAVQTMQEGKRALFVLEVLTR